MAKTIIVADDDPDIVRAVCMLLEDEGYIAIPTVNGKTEELVDSRQPDLILLDIWMSGIDGRDICRRLKNDPETSTIPVILISANRDTEQIARAAGADGFLPKPFDITELLKMVEIHLAGADSATGQTATATQSPA